MDYLIQNGMHNVCASTCSYYICSTSIIVKQHELWHTVVVMCLGKGLIMTKLLLGCCIIDP